MNVIVATVFVVPHTGGASTHIEQLCLSLKSRGHTVVLLEGGRLKVPLWVRLFDRMRFFPRVDVARASLLERTARLLEEQLEKGSRNWPVDIIHCHDPLSTCAALAMRPAGVRIVETVHGPWSKENQSLGVGSTTPFNQKLRELECRAFAGADVLLPVDQGQARILEKEFQVQERRIRIIENAVDVDQLISIKPAARPRREGFLFLVPRRLVPKNGVEYAIRALAHLHRRDVGLMIAGDGPLRRSCEHLVREYGLGSQVCFLGNVCREELIGLMKLCTGVIVSSVPVDGVVEATSLSVLEGMACGMPVIGSNIGGIAEIVRHKVNGFLSTPADPESLALNMRAVISLSASDRRELSRAAQERVRSCFSTEMWVDRITSAYQC